MPDTTRWYPPQRAGQWTAWATTVAAVFALLTNGYYVRFLEPVVSRQSLVLLLLCAAGTVHAVCHFGLPSTREGQLEVLRSLLVPATLLGILGVAFWLRVWGIPSGLPLSYVPDEYDYVHAALVRLKRGDFNPRWWYYPSLHTYLMSLVFFVVFLGKLPSGAWANIHQVHEEDMIYWARFLSVVFGVLTVFLAYWLGKRIANVRVGLMAAALLAVFPAAVEHSQTTKPDAIMAFTAALSVLVALVYLERGGTKLAIATGATIGLAVSSKYNGFLVVFPFLFAALFLYGRDVLKRPDLYVSGVASVLTFVVINPYFLADFVNFIDHVAFDIYSYGFTGRPGADGENNWLHHASYTMRYGAGYLASVAVIAGLLLMLFKLDAKRVVFLSFPVMFYAHYSAQKINWPGNLLTVYAFFGVVAAFAVDAMLGWLSSQKNFAVVERYRWAFSTAILLVMMWAPARVSALYNRTQMIPDTGNVARVWLDASFPPGTVFAVERHAPVPDREKYKVLQEARIIRKAVKDYRELGVAYLVVSSQVYERFGPAHRVTKAYARLFEICPLVKEFQPVDERLRGPTIRILRVPDEAAPAS